MMYCPHCENPVTYDDKAAKKCPHCGKNPNEHPGSSAVPESPKREDGDKGRYNLVIGPIEPNLDGFSSEDRREWLEEAGWQNVRIEWVDDKRT